MGVNSKGSQRWSVKHPVRCLSISLKLPLSIYSARLIKSVFFSDVVIASTLPVGIEAMV